MKPQNNKIKSPKNFFALDTRKVAFVDLGQHPSIHGALQRRNAEARSFSRVISDTEMKQLRADAKKYTLAGGYFYLSNENKLVEMGAFPTEQAAKQHALTKLFGVSKLMIASAHRIRKALERLDPPVVVEAAPALTAVAEAPVEEAVAA